MGASARKQVVEATERGYKYLTALFDSTHSFYQWNARLFPWNRNPYFPRVLAHGDTFPGGIVAGRAGGMGGLSHNPKYNRKVVQFSELLNWLGHGLARSGGHFGIGKVCGK